MEGVEIEPAQGFMSDHYVPGRKLLRLSSEVYGGRSLAAVGVAAHESGHAIQDARRYPLLVMRNFLVPVASIGSNVAWIVMIAGFVLSLMPLVYVGIVAFSTTVVFQLVNLPVEFDATGGADGAVAIRASVLPRGRGDQEGAGRGGADLFGGNADKRTDVVVLPVPVGPPGRPAVGVDPIATVGRRSSCDGSTAASSRRSRLP